MSQALSVPASLFKSKHESANNSTLEEELAESLSVFGKNYGTDMRF